MVLMSWWGMVFKIEDSGGLCISGVFGTISDIKLLEGGIKPVLQAPNLTLIFRSGSQHLVSCSVLVE